MTSTPPPGQDRCHGSCVALAGAGVLIIGASGTGKSALALALMAIGARLIADDQVLLHRQGDDILARAPASIAGMIEARGIGLLRARALPEIALRLVVDLDRSEPDRLPPRREFTVLNCSLPLVLGKDLPHLSFGIAQYLRGGRQD